MKWLLALSLTSYFSANPLASAAFCTRDGANTELVVPRRVKCGTKPSDISQEFTNLLGQLKANRSSLVTTAAADPVIISTYFHIVTLKNQSTLVSNDTIQQQIAAMNFAYSKSRFQFRLDGVDRTQNDDWAFGGDPNFSPFDAQMKRTLRNGTYSTLNIYFQSGFLNSTKSVGLPFGFIGHCSFPLVNLINRHAPADFTLDGCNVDISGMPGSSDPSANLGYTAAHETGHWLGLIHPFDGNQCLIDGDFVADTPYQSIQTFDCPPVKKSCPRVEINPETYGGDSIHNFMDYSDDCCVDQFTPLQMTRMSDMWTLMREGL